MGSTVMIIHALNALMNLAVDAGISITKFNDMREQSGGNLTDEQVEELANEADAAVDRM